MFRRDLLAKQLKLMGIAVPEEAYAPLLWFLEELGRWNRRINLTAITDPEEGVEKHLVDSLTLLPLLRGDETVLDVGSGGGFPGLPLKIVYPQLKICSIDAIRKKIEFQQHVVRKLALKGFDPIHGRIEERVKDNEWAGAFEIVTARAFASLVDLVRLALPALAPGGRILAMKGSGGERELKEALPDLSEMGVICTEVRRLILPISGAGRTLFTLERIEKG